MYPDKTSTCDTQTPLPQTREGVQAAARRWLGTRWVHQGRGVPGLDCAGLVIKVHEGVGLVAEDMQGYRRTPNSIQFLEHIRRQTKPAASPTPGSIVIFRQDKFACHVGIVGWHPRYDCLSIIHAHAIHKAVVEEPFSKEWFHVLVETRDIIGLQD